MSSYDHHQRIRTKAVRLLSKKNYPAAITLLHDGSVKMLQAGEQGSGCDLGIYMVDVYTQADTKPDQESRGRILDILKLAKPDFWRKKFTDAVSKWLSAAVGDAGDPLLRYEVAKLFWKEGSYFQSEPHFHAAIVPPSAASGEQPQEVAGAAADLGVMMVDWLEAHATKSAQKLKESKHPQDAAVIQRVEAGRFALRGLLLLIASGKVPAAHAFLKSYITTLIERPACKSLPLPASDNPRSFSAPPGLNPPARQVAPPGQEKTYTQSLWLTANADLNFSQMCLGLVDCAWRIKGEAMGLSRSERGTGAAPEALRNAWIALVRQYSKEGVASAVDPIVNERINSISTLLFDLQPPRGQGNMLADMMSSLFGGAGGAGGAAPPPQGAKWVEFRQPTEPVVLREEEEEDEAKKETAAATTGKPPAPAAPPVEEDLD